MTSKAPIDLDVNLGSPVLPSSVRRVRSDHRGALSFYFDTEDHDLDLLRSLAAAVRDEPETVERLRQYADVMDRRDAAEREDNYPLRRSFESEASDLRDEIEHVMEWGGIGEVGIAVLRPAESGRLVDVLSGDVEAAEGVAA